MKRRGIQDPEVRARRVKEFLDRNIDQALIRSDREKRLSSMERKRKVRKRFTKRRTGKKM